MSMKSSWVSTIPFPTKWYPLASTRDISSTLTLWDLTSSLIAMNIASALEQWRSKGCWGPQDNFAFEGPYDK